MPKNPNPAEYGPIDPDILRNFREKADRLLSNIGFCAVNFAGVVAGIEGQYDSCGTPLKGMSVMLGTYTLANSMPRSPIWDLLIVRGKLEGISYGWLYRNWLTALSKGVLELGRDRFSGDYFEIGNAHLISPEELRAFYDGQLQTFPSGASVPDLYIPIEQTLSVRHMPKW